MATTKDWILVGTSGSPGSAAAVSYAAHEAARSGSALRIVHVAPPYRPLLSLYPDDGSAAVTLAEVEALGSAILQQAVYAAQWYLPEEGRGRATASGGRADVLLAAAHDASMMVIGRSQVTGTRRVATGSLAAAVAGRATVPVVVVPSDWAPSEPHGLVIAALKRLEAIPEGLVRGALRLAAKRAATLKVVHVGAAGTRPSVSETPLTEHRGTDDSAARWILRRIADLVADLPGLHVVAQVLAGDPATLLVEQSDSADALVIARRPGQPPGGSFGSIGHAVLRSASCPVIVLPVAEEPAPDESNLAMAAAGQHPRVGEEGTR